MPHTHIQILIPPSEIDVSTDTSETSNTLWRYVGEYIVPNIDFIKSRLFLDDTVNNYLAGLPNSANACGNLPWGTLFTPPQQLPFTIDGNASDWASYTPVLTDPSGDSQAGVVMDFTELYTAKDDNYLYIMVKAGNNPGSKAWSMYFHLDTNNDSKCGLADKTLVP